MDELFSIATGCLGWAPSEVWACTVPEILMAWDAKVEFIRNTNPFGKGSAGGSADTPSIPENESIEDRRARIKAQMRMRKDREL